MKLEINLPYSLVDYNLSGVYRLQFEDGDFYIGSSKNIRKRAYTWNMLFERGGKANGVEYESEKIMDKILQGVPAKIEVVELCSIENLRDRESFYLDKYKDDAKMISSEERGAWKAILQYTLSGCFVKKHYSISEAARYNNTTMSSIQRVLSGERNKCKEMVFIYEHDYHKRRQSINSDRYLIKNKKNGRRIAVKTLNGEIVDVFQYMTEVAKKLNLSTANISRVLNGRQKTAKGYLIEYMPKE